MPCNSGGDKQRTQATREANRALGSGCTLASMMATDARFTLAQLKHWDTRLSQELEILEHDIEASEATHHKCAQPSRCVCRRRPDVEGLSQVRRQVLRGAARAACLARREGVALG